MVAEFLEQDHRSLGLLLDQLEQAFAAADFSQAYKLLDLFWARLATHIRSENLCLFPAIVNADSGLFLKKGLPSIEKARHIVSELQADHSFFMDELAQAVIDMRKLLQGQSELDLPALIGDARGRIAAVKDRLEEHNRIEEQEVYRWPSALLSPSELSDLQAEVRRQTENLPPRFTSDDITTKGLSR